MCVCACVRVCVRACACVCVCVRVCVCVLYVITSHWHCHSMDIHNLLLRAHLLGEVIVNDQSMFPVVSEVLAHGTTRVWRQIL